MRNSLSHDRAAAQGKLKTSSLPSRRWRALPAEALPMLQAGGQQCPLHTIELLGTPWPHGRRGGIAPFSGRSFSILSERACRGLSPADESTAPVAGTVNPAAVYIASLKVVPDLTPGDGEHPVRHAIRESSGDVVPYHEAVLRIWQRTQTHRSGKFHRRVPG